MEARHDAVASGVALSTCAVLRSSDRGQRQIEAIMDLKASEFQR